MPRHHIQLFLHQTQSYKHDKIYEKLVKNKFEFVDSMILLLELHNKTSSNPLLFAYLLANTYKSELRDLMFESFDGDF
jgi:hypothetical protein